MNTARFKDPDYAELLAEATSSGSMFDPVIEQRTRDIIQAVQSSGDAALVELTARFDKATLLPEDLRVSAAEMFAAALKASPRLRRSAAAAVKNIAGFSRRSLRKNWSARNSQGAVVGEKYNPFQRVGIYIPGGTAPLISTALMTITLAKEAGCPEIVVCSPSGPSGWLNESLLFAIRFAGATEVYKLGGAQAIAAMALGTGSVPKVQKIFGPGNAYVVAAKRLLFGHVSIDLLPGPSELLVLADDSASARFVAADMLAQAEHGSGHERVWLVTPSQKLIGAVQKEVERQLPLLLRKDYIGRALKKNGWLIHTRSMKEAVCLTNRIAPEHCEVVTRDAGKVSKEIKTAGAIFLGNLSPTVLGDYIAGPSHELPTGGAGACFSGLTADQFQRRTSVVQYTIKALRQSVPLVAHFAELEGLDAHGRSAAIRLENLAPGKATKSSKRSTSSRPSHEPAR